MARLRQVAFVLIAAPACSGIVVAGQATDPTEDASALVDATAADATAGVWEPSGQDGGVEGTAPGAAVPAPCEDDATVESGVPFACAPLWPEAGFGTCWSATQYCYWEYNPARQRGQSGCYPFPCDCGAMPSCACLDVPGAGGGCTDDGGIVVMWGPNGIQ